MDPVSVNTARIGRPSLYAISSHDNDLQPDTALNYSEIRSSKRGVETGTKQPLPANNTQQNPLLPFIKSVPTVSVAGTDPNNTNPRVRLAADALGQELRPQASIWKMYVEEAAEQDVELVEVQNKNLDLMLLFAALFSAILTAFLIESTNMLQQDPAEASAALLLFIAQSQRRIELGIPASALDPIENGKFSPTLISRFINGLWFTALALSLAAALIAMLAKEWLASYLATSIRPAYERSLARQIQFDGLVAWRTLPIISFLPTLLHLSLLLFSLGLAVYLWALDTGIAVVVAIITGLTMAFYATTLICGTIFDPCPFVTQLSKYSRAALSFYIPDWKPRSVTLRSEALIAHGSIKQVESRALSWLAKNSHDPAVVDCAYEAVAGHIAINPSSEAFTKSKQDTAEANSQPAHSSTQHIAPYSAESNNILFFTSICTRLSELIRKGPKATKAFHGPSLARYASALPRLLQHIKDDIGSKAADTYIQHVMGGSSDDHNYSIKSCASTALENIDSIFSDKWGPLSADEYALLSAAHLSLTEVLAQPNMPRAQTPPPSPSQNKAGHDLVDHPPEPRTREHPLPTRSQSNERVPESLVLSCGLALARTSIQLRYHLSQEARISETYLITLLKATSAVLAQEPFKAEAECSVRVLGAVTENHIPPRNDQSQLSKNTLVETLLKLIVDTGAAQIPDFPPIASRLLALAASPYLNEQPANLTPDYWLAIHQKPLNDIDGVPPAVISEMRQDKVWMTRQAVAISALSFTAFDWLPVTALGTLNQMLKDRSTWYLDGVQLDHGRLIEHWIGETYKLLFNQKTKEDEALAKTAQCNLIGSVGQIILVGDDFADLSTASWNHISWENCLVPLLTIISLTPKQPREVNAILQYLTIPNEPAFRSMLKLFRSSKGFPTFRAIRHHAGYGTGVTTAISSLLGTSQLQISEENVKGFLEEVSFIINDKASQRRTALIEYAMDCLENAQQRQVRIPWDDNALVDIQKYLEGDSGDEAKRQMERLKRVLDINLKAGTVIDNNRGAMDVNS